MVTDTDPNSVAVCELMIISSAFGECWTCTRYSPGVIFEKRNVPSGFKDVPIIVGVEPPVPSDASIKMPRKIGLPLALTARPEMVAIRVRAIETLICCVS
jgi:hypothetical protein